MRSPPHPEDRLGRHLSTLRISVMDRCNLRCPYCMPKARFGERYQFLPEHELLTFDELERLACLFAQVGVTQLRLTGGEPLLRPGLPELVRRLRRTPGITKIALTTNGTLLEEMALALKDAGVDRVTVSLDTVDGEGYAALSGVGADVSPVLRGIERALEVGLRPVKINAVIIRGVNDAHVVPLVQRFRGTGVVVRFIEYMDVGTRNGWRREQVVPTAELLQTLSQVAPLQPVPRGAAEDTAETYRFSDGSGDVGFISSVSRPFCRDCTRGRLSAEGRFLTCLFAESGVGLKQLLRTGATDDVLLATIRRTWLGREDRYSEHRSTSVQRHPSSRVEMYEVGG